MTIRENNKIFTIHDIIFVQVLKSYISNVKNCIKINKEFIK